MILSAFHFISIAATFILIVTGYPYFSLIPFSLALLLTFLISTGKKSFQTSNQADNSPSQKNPTAEKLTKVLLNQSHGNQKGPKEYWQEFKGENVGNIQIDRLNQTVGKQKSMIPVFWLLFILGIIIWGAYNLIIHDKPYVPLSRVYEKELVPANSHQSGQPQNKSRDLAASKRSAYKGAPNIQPQSNEKIVPNVTITQEMLDEAWGHLKPEESNTIVSQKANTSISNSATRSVKPEDDLNYYYAIQLKTGERIISKTVVIDKDAVDYIDKEGLMTSVDRSLIKSLKKYYYKRKNSF